MLNLTKRDAEQIAAMLNRRQQLQTDLAATDAEWTALEVAYDDLRQRRERQGKRLTRYARAIIEVADRDEVESVVGRNADVAALDWIRQQVTAQFPDVLPAEPVVPGGQP